MADSERIDAEDRPLNTDRIVVLGTTGAGKTTLAAEIARALGVPHFELDYYRFRPNWVETQRRVQRERERGAAGRQVGGGRQLRPRAGCHLAEGHHAGVAGLPDLRGDVEAVLADDRSRGASEGAVARKQGEAVVALRDARFAVSVGAEDSLASGVGRYRSSWRDRSTVTWNWCTCGRRGRRGSG